MLSHKTKVVLYKPGLGRVTILLLNICTRPSSNLIAKIDKIAATQH
jgi:hypothetical protein